MTESPPSGHRFISAPDELLEACAQLAHAEWLALDTEFERSRTFYAELCLVQIAAPAQLYCIDPLALDDLTAFTALLRQYSGRKLLHAARQDLEVLYALAGALPCDPVLDTQIAAALAGYADNIGYADLVAQVLGITLDKSQTRTDWRQRPLTAAQLAYAADDVRYLAPVTAHLLARLRELGREAWLIEDCQALLRPATYDQPVELAWQRVKGLSSLSPAATARAMVLAEWRETTARERNLPRGWVVKDDELLHVAQNAPSTVRELVALTSANAGALRRHGEAVIELLQTASTEHLPPRPRRPNAAGRAMCKQMATRAQAVAQTLAIAPTILVTRRELEAVVCGETPARLLAGWRQQVLAPMLADFGAADGALLWEV